MKKFSAPRGACRGASPSRGEGIFICGGVLGEGVRRRGGPARSFVRGSRTDAGEAQPRDGILVRDDGDELRHARARRSRRAPPRASTKCDGDGARASLRPFRRGARLVRTDRYDLVMGGLMIFQKTRIVFL